MVYTYSELKPAKTACGRRGDVTRRVSVVERNLLSLASKATVGIMVRDCTVWVGGCVWVPVCLCLCVYSSTYTYPIHIQLRDCTVESLLPGAPAATSASVRKGDRIVEIDGAGVHPDLSLSRYV